MNEIPAWLPKYFPNLTDLNVNNNRLENIYQTVDVLSGLSQLYSLYINLVTEEEVDYVLRKLANLEFLNGLGVDRDEINAASKQEEDKNIDNKDET